MSSATSSGRMQHPTDDDLYHLYEEVRRGFALDNPTTSGGMSLNRNGSDFDSIIDQYNRTDASSELPSYSGDRRSTAIEKVEGVPFPNPQSPARGRPLPKPPMLASASSNSSTSTSGMYYSDQAAQNRQNLSSPPLHEHSRHGSIGTNGGLRRLPAAPEASASTILDGGRNYGLSPPPIIKQSTSSDSTYQRQTSVAGPSRSPLPSHSYVSAMAVADGSSKSNSLDAATNGYDASLTRAESVRPKGALPPSVPGHSGSYLYRDSLSSPTGSLSSADFYASSTAGDNIVNHPRASESLSQNYRPATDPALRDYTPHHVPNSLSPGSPPPIPKVSSRIELDPILKASADALPVFTTSRPSINPLLGRSTSTGSTNSSFQSGSQSDRIASTPISSNNGRSNTVTSTNTQNTTNSTVDRGDSFSSYTSIGSYNSGIRVDDDGYDTYRNGGASTSLDVRRVQGDRLGPSDPRNRRVLDDIKRQLALHEGFESDDEVDDYEEDDRFVNLALLSHIAVRLRDKVPRGTHVKGGIPYPRAFTGKDIVSTIQAQIQRELLNNMQMSSADRRPALQLARSLQSQLFFCEVEWGGRVLQDGVEDVYMFLDDQEGGADTRREQEELPTGVFTPLTKCYSPSCLDGLPNSCYSFTCPRRQRELPRGESLISLPEPVREPKIKEWSELIDKSVLRSLPESEISRQTIIHKAIDKEELYVQDLDLIETLFMRPLRLASPPIIPPEELDSFMDEVFHNILDLRDVNRRLLEVMEVRQREQYPIIQKIGDVFLTAATDFRSVYPIYVGNLPLAEKRLKDETDRNAELRRFLDQCLRAPESRRMDLKHFLTRPSEHLQKYPVLLEAIYKETAEGNPDADFLSAATQAIKNLQTVSQLRTFQAAMCRGPTNKYEWYDLVPEEIRSTISKQEAKRQSIIFEVIKGEMMYVKDLESIGTMYVKPLTTEKPPIIPHDRLSSFLHDVYHNYADLLALHQNLLERLHEIQREEHPQIRSITAPILDAALNWHDAYMEYVPNHPIAHYRIDEEMNKNPDFKAFAESTQRNPDSRRLDMKNFVHRPVARLTRYELLLSSILKETPSTHEDKEAIPQVLEVLKQLLKETETGVQSAKERVEIWQYNQNLVFKPGEAIDMDLLDENRSLIHSGKLLRPSDTSFEFGGWTELFVLLFDNYLVMTKPKDRDGIAKYHVNRRPIPLDLLSIVNFTDPPQQRSKGILGGFRGGDKHDPSTTSVNNAETQNDARFVYPCTIHHNGRQGGVWTVYAESSQARVEWKQKLDEAIVLRKVVTDANKVFEIETLSSDTFLVPSFYSTPAASSWADENIFTGKVTCSVPFSTPDGRGLVAVGCAEGVWIGLRHDPRSMRRVLQLKMVTQCAMLEDFGIFLVLADKALFAYHIEALVPSSPPSANASRTPQKLNGNKDVQFFTVGTLGGRTLVIYMKKKGLDSVFRVLEPVIGKINEKSKPGGLSRFGFGSQRSEWFRIFRDFFLPSESYDLIFLKAKIAILCSKGFEIMDLTDFKSVTIPNHQNDPRLQQLIKRFESCKPIGMFRSSENEFLLCYEFGFYVDRHGEPSRSVGTIEWEGTAERVAWHPPYILLFDSRFIEIRHVETGRLAQIIPGNDVRCLWDGRGSNGPPVGTPGPDGWVESVSQEARVHAVMTAQEEPGSARNNRAVAQHVFQLVPTIPLYLPGSLSSPAHETYFPQTSPTSSPPLNPRNSWK